MTILMSDFGKYVSGLIRSVSRLNQDEHFIKMLLLEANKQFLKFNDEAWAKDKLDIELIHYFTAYEEAEDNPVFLLILYVLISMKLSSISDYDLNVISSLAGVLETYKIPSTQFKAYLAMVLHRPIHDCLSRLSENERVFAIMELFDNVPYNSVLSGDFTSAYDVLSKYDAAPVSSFFGDDYSLQNIYNVLSAFLNNPLNKKYFSEEEFANLERLLKLDEFGDENDKRAIARRVTMIESANARTPLQMVHIILKSIEGYHCYKTYGIDIPLDDDPIRL